jgi:hypothetical protein
MGNWTASHSGKWLFKLLALGARPGRWRCPLALGICRTCYRGGRAVFWNLPFNPAGARYLDKTRQWKLIRRGRSEPLGRCRAFPERSWSAGRGQHLKPTGQRSRHQAQLETLGGQIGSICAMRVSSRSYSGYKALPVVPAWSSRYCISCAPCILAA